MTRVLETVHRTWRTLRHDDGGNVILTFAVSFLPLVALVGAAVDYSRASSARVALQAALDSTTLMLSKEVQSLTQDQMNQKANDYFKTQFTRPEAKNVVITTSYDASTSTMTMSASASLDTALIRVVGHKSMSISSSTMVKWGNDRLRVALALDNTGSMNDAGKLAALKTATTSLLGILKAAALQNGDVYVSIVPFSRNVNVGGSNFNANWIDWAAWDAKYTVSAANGYWCWNGSCWNGSAWVAEGTVASHNTWNGCVMDRGTAAAPGTAAGYDQKVDPPVAGNAATLFPAAVDSSCPAELKQLTYDWTALNNMVQSMVATGNTNQPIGLVWAWQSLAGGGPVNVPAKDPNYVYRDIIILLSDGLNTQDRWYTSQSSIDTRMYDPANGAGTCDNIKKANITIYAVQVNTGGDPVSTLLQNCASNGKFFHLTAANQMVMTFNQIGTEIAKLRIAR